MRDGEKDVAALRIEGVEAEAQSCLQTNHLTDYLVVMVIDYDEMTDDSVLCWRIQNTIRLYFPNRSEESCKNSFVPTATERFTLHPLK